MKPFATILLTAISTAAILSLGFLLGFNYKKDQLPQSLKNPINQKTEEKSLSIQQDDPFKESRLTVEAKEGDILIKSQKWLGGNKESGIAGVEFTFKNNTLYPIINTIFSIDVYPLKEEVKGGSQQRPSGRFVCKDIIAPSTEFTQQFYFDKLDPLLETYFIKGNCYSKIECETYTKISKR